MKRTEVAFLEPKNISIDLALSLGITHSKPLLTWYVTGRHISVGTFCYNNEFCLCDLDDAGINWHILSEHPVDDISPSSHVKIIV